jgi:uncharacterized RDD family membrane protein YckC
MPHIVPFATATAPALDTLAPPVPQPRLEEPPRPPSPLSGYQPGYQPSLFADSYGPKVIPLPVPTLTPFREPRREAAPRSPRSATARPAPARRSQRLANDSQQTLDFFNDPPLDLQMETFIRCDATVAPPALRIMAALADAAMITLAASVFFGIFYLAGGDDAFTRENLPWFGAAIAVIGLFYRLLWCLANGDSPGLKFAGLQVVDFNGWRPDRRTRAIRQIASVLSLVSAGLGLIWAHVDEERLTWHDHISKTFPTPS